MSLVTQVATLTTRVGTEFKAIRTEIVSGLSAKIDKATLDANTVLIATVDDTPSALSMPASTFLVRLATGNIVAGTVAQVKTLLALVKADVGLGNVDNTSDVNKPVSTLQQTALDLKQNLLGYTAENVANKGAANGYAPLDGTTKIAAVYLPAYVDDVLEFANFAALPGSGTAGVIYVTIDNGKTFRWGGSAYAEISASPGSTDVVPEGVTNLYYTQTRTDARINTLLDAQMGDEATDFVAVFEAALV